MVALIYIVINSALSKVATRLEARQRRRYQAGGIRVAGIEDLAITEVTAEVAAAVDQPGRAASL